MSRTYAGKTMPGEAALTETTRTRRVTVEIFTELVGSILPNGNTMQSGSEK